MIKNNIGQDILIRVFIGVAICPFVTAILVSAPIYFANSNSRTLLIFSLLITIPLSYLVVIIVGLPSTFYLAVKNKCSYKWFAITGFVLGVVSFIVFFIKLNLESSGSPYSTNNQDLVTNDIWPTIFHSLWYGFSAAAGAVLFGFISSLPKWYNKSSNLTGKKDLPSS